MTLRIVRYALGKRVILQLAGNLRIEHLDELNAQIKAAGRDIVLDVSGVKLISLEGICFLNTCESRGVAVRNASPYILEWMTLERDAGPKGT